MLRGGTLVRQYVPLIIGWPILIWSLGQIGLLPDDIGLTARRLSWTGAFLLLGFCVSELAREPAYKWSLREQVWLGLVCSALLAIICNADQLGN